MGFFDRKKQSSELDPGTRGEGYFDANVEEISLNKPTSAEEPRADAAAPKSEPARPARSTNYGIEKAIELMRMIPFSANNEEQFVIVIKKTLESTNISVPGIIGDADLKLKNLEGEIGMLRDDIKNFEAEIEKRKKRIEELQTDHQETSQVKSRLELAEQLTAKEAKPAEAPPKSSAKSAGPPKAAQK
ncbi:MAG: hypothetical protein KC609_19470 [Myxococcales bacterium]|nr:hypothetical protein [Myxococcales bacterium]